MQHYGLEVGPFPCKPVPELSEPVASSELLECQDDSWWVCCWNDTLIRSLSPRSVSFSSPRMCVLALQIGSLCTGRAGACVVHLRSSWRLEPHLVPSTLPPGCTETEFHYLISHGWYTSKCPCERIPKQQGEKTYRTTSTSTEPSHNQRSLTCVNCDHVPSAKRPASSSSSPSPSPSPSGSSQHLVQHVYEEIGAVGGAASTQHCRRVLVTSTSIDFIDLNDDDRYANVNPGYKSTTPPEDITVQYPALSQPFPFDPSMASCLPTVEELSEGPDVRVLPASSSTRSVGQVEEYIRSGGCRQASVSPRSSWSGPEAVHKSPPPPHAHVKSVSSPCGFLDSPSRSRRSPKSCSTTGSKTNSPRSSVHVDSNLATPPRSPKTPQDIKPRTKIPTPPKPARGSWSAQSSKDDPKNHFYWELELPHKMTQMGLSKSTSTKSTSAGPTLAAKDTKDKKKVRRSSGGDHHPSSSTPSPRLEQQNNSPRLQQRSASLSSRLHNLMSCHKDASALTGSGDCSTSAIWVPRPHTLTTGAKKLDVAGSKPRPGRRSQSCEHLAALQKGKDSSRRFKRRCPTPPRLLSPSLENVACEGVTDI